MLNYIFGLLEKSFLRNSGIMSPERAHDVANYVLENFPLLPGGIKTDSRLKTNIGRIKLKHPLGIAAGFDKNAKVYGKLLSYGFSFVEVGTVTPKPQKGNSKPRLFRFKEQGAIINSMGFNNDGMERLKKRLLRRDMFPGTLGVSLGANKETPDYIDDYAELLNYLWGHCDYFTVNISSPNTSNLRRMQHRDTLVKLLEKLQESAYELLKSSNKFCPIFIKISPDLSIFEQQDIASICLDVGVSGIVATNTTISRPIPSSLNPPEIGGLSGTPLFEASTQVLRNMYQFTKGRIPIIASGGVMTPKDVYKKIRSGASAVQLYSGLVYSGLNGVSTWTNELLRLMDADNLKNIKEAIGKDFH